MKTIKILILLISVIANTIIAQGPPTPAQKESFLITGAKIHVGNGMVINNGCIGVDSGKIVYVGEYFASNTVIKSLKKIIRVDGKQIYPGFIALGTSMGLQEIESVRATRDYDETGSWNASVRSIIAYNTDSKIIPTVRNSGVLLAQVKPEGGIISGQSSVVQMDAWNWEDAAISTSDGIWINWPNLYKWQSGEGLKKDVDYEKKVIELYEFITNTRNYKPTVDGINLNYEALNNAISNKKKIYINCSKATEIIDAIRFIKKNNLNGVLYNADNISLVADFVSESKVPVILNQTHRLPNKNEELDSYYKLPQLLNSKKIKFSIAIEGFYQTRNLNYQTGQAVSYGLDYEKGIESITLSAAQILGIDKNYGSIELGKSATFFVSNGDVLDMRTSIVELAFIDGREIDLNDKQKELYIKYKNKYQNKQ
jgi:imidazolonepropionase-like amidohydrolase